ncbi:MAG: hypothetical protein MUP73_03430 [Dehalococcoidia bacterium]|nr:hypothetical protein [Dehalococcoidia bacterium]
MATTTVSSGLPTSRKRVANRRGGLWGGDRMALFGATATIEVGSFA